MYTPILVSVLSTLSLVAATPAANWGPWQGGQWNGGPCVSAAAVQNIVDGYTYLLEHPGGPDFNATANALLDNDFQVFSDSIQTLQGAPLGVPSYPSKQAFIYGQFETPPIPVVTTTQYFASCTNIAWRWTGSGIGSNAFPVNGIITFDLDFNGPSNVNGGALIKTVYSEFNTAKWLVDLGVTACVPPPRPSS